MNLFCFAQRRLWFLHQLKGPSATYNLPAVVRFVGGLDLDALCAAVSDVVWRHGSLRTVFAEVEGQLTQRVLSADAARPVVSVEHVDEGAIGSRLVEVAQYKFDLSVNIPVRAWLFVLGCDEHVLLMSMHHVAGDGWSMEPLARDLRTAYLARSRGETPTWSSFPVQYMDFTLLNNTAKLACNTMNIVVFVRRANVTKPQWTSADRRNLTVLPW